MTEILYVNEDWSALVPAGSPDARYGIQPKDAKRRGLLPLQPGEPEPEPLETLSLMPEPEPETEPEPEAKQEPKPANKRARKPRNK